VMGHGGLTGGVSLVLAEAYNGDCGGECALLH
jgi:hypothetical protein